MHEFIMKEKKKKTLLGMVALSTWQRIPFLTGPLLKANFPIETPRLIALSYIALLLAKTQYLFTYR
jgi:hypothetical protein